MGSDLFKGDDGRKYLEHEAANKIVSLMEDAIGGA